MSPEKLLKVTTCLKKNWLSAIQSQGFGSQDECRKLISQGRARYLDKIVMDYDSDVWLRPGTMYQVDRQPYRWYWRLYLAYHKPAGTVSALHTRDSPDRRGDFPEIWFNRWRSQHFRAIFPLSPSASGLVIYSDDRFLHSHVTTCLKREQWQPVHTFNVTLGPRSPKLSERLIEEMKGGVEIERKKWEDPKKKQELEMKALLQRAEESGENPVVTELEKELEKQMAQLDDELSPLEMLEQELQQEMEMSADAFKQGSEASGVLHDLDKSSICRIESCEPLELEKGAGWKIETKQPNSLKAMLKHAGLRVQTLQRVGIDDLNMHGIVDDDFLEPGEWRIMTGREIACMAGYTIKKVTDIRKKEAEHSRNCLFLKRNAKNAKKKI